VSGYVSQISNQAAIVSELVKLIRSGAFSSPPSKVVLLGHSLGSVISNIAIHNDPELVDAALLTGLAYGATSGAIGPVSYQAKQNRVANLYQPERFGKLDGAYAVWADIYSAIELYDLLVPVQLSSLDRY